MTARTDPPLPPAQQALRARCTHPSGSRADFPREEIEGSVPDRLERIVRRYPDRLAVKTSSYLLTYAELDAMANRVARAVLARHGGQAAPIAVLLEKDAPLIAAMLGVLKAGHFFVLLDPQSPPARIADILEDSQAIAVITDRHDARRAEEVAGDRSRVLEIDADTGDPSPPRLSAAISPAALAFLNYTSGSTGRPKAAAWNHRTLLHNMMLFTNAFHLCEQDRVVVLTSATSNAIMNSLAALLSGAALLPFDVHREGVIPLAAWLVREKVTVCPMSAPLFRTFVDTLRDPAGFPDLRILRLTSETVYDTDVEQYKRYFSPDCVLVNALNTTETGLLRTYLMDRATDVPAGEVPAGYAVEDKEVVLLGDDGEAVGFDEVGEIAVRSRYLIAGYWRRPDLDQAKFKPDPAGGDARLYLTGDLGLMRPDGCLVHKGRKDFRVKIRGYGVEVEEVERALRGHPAVREAVVVARRDERGDGRLVAYYTTRDAAPPGAREWRGFLQATLPEHMIPSAFVAIDAIPLTPNGKVDRAALPDPDRSRPPLGVAFVAPRTPIEERLVRIWEAVLNARPIGVLDDLFDLGAHSLLVARLHNRIEQDFRVALPVRALFESPTIAGLAALLEPARGGHPGWPEERARHSRVITLQSGNSGKAIFCFPFAGGFKDEYVNLARLARLLGTTYSVYALPARGADGVTSPHRQLEQMAADYAMQIRLVQPTGPYVLIGDCGGCAEAYETARQLRREGDAIALLAVLDDEGRRPWRRYLWRRLTGRLRYRLDRITESRPWTDAKARLTARLHELRHRNGRDRLRYFCARMFRAAAAAHLGREAAPDSPPARTSGGNAGRSAARHMGRARQARYLARRRYRHQPYDGRVTLLVNEEWHRWHERHDGDPTLGWAALAAGGVEVHRIPGNHDTYITQNIHEVAATLSACLQRSESRRSAP